MLKSEYDKYREQYQTKYGKPTNTKPSDEEGGDDMNFGRYNFSSEWALEEGKIKVEMSLPSRIVIRYEDKVNFRKCDREEKQKAKDEYERNMDDI